MSKVVNNSANGVTVGSVVDGVTIGAVMVGAPGQTHVVGDAANDYIVGSPNHSIIVAGTGDDVLCGGAPLPNGFDPSHVFVFHRGSGNDVITDFNSSDQIDLTGYLNHGVTPTVTDGAMGAVIELGATSSITLIGVASWQLVETPSGFTMAQLLVG